MLIPLQVVHGLSIPLGKLGYLAPRTLSRVVSEGLSDDVQARERRRNIPFIGRYIGGRDKKQARPATGPIVITGARRLHPELPLHSEGTQTDGTQTPQPRGREIRFPDEF